MQTTAHSPETYCDVSRGPEVANQCLVEDDAVLEGQELEVPIMASSGAS